MLTKLKEGIDKAVSHLELEFSKLQAGRANPAMVEDIRVESYGSLQPLKNIASINNIDNQTISIKPWDKSVIHAIAKSITDAGTGLNPQTMADSIMIKIPQVTEERRKELVKIAKKEAEEARVSIRNVRQDALKSIKKLKENDELTEDDVITHEKDLQKQIDEGNIKIDDLIKKKEEDLMKL